MNSNVKICIALAIVGGIIGSIGLIAMFSNSANPFASLMLSTLPVWLGIIGGSLFVLGLIIAGNGPSQEPATKPVKSVKKEAAAKPAKVDLSSMKKLPIIRVEGIGPKYAEKLNAARIITTKDLLEAGRKQSGREDLAQKTGISIKLISEWVRDADFIRIKGISEEYSDLLDEVNVKDVVELAKQDPENLHSKMLERSKQKRIVRRPPSLSEVTKWIDQAKKLPKIVEH